jgi:hypothetical protein
MNHKIYYSVFLRKSMTIKPILCFILLILYCGFFSTKASADEYPDGYWIWAGRTVPDFHSSSKPILYIHQGTFERCVKQACKQRAFIFNQSGLAPHPLKGNAIWIVFRLEALIDKEILIRTYLSAKHRWESHGNHVIGLQLDFDSPTKKLESYCLYLENLRPELKNSKLSVTGLADWSVNANTETLNRLAKVSSEIIFQLYNGNSKIPNLDQYAQKLLEGTLPFKIGILETQEDILINSIRLGKYYRGTVIFLQKRANYEKNRITN